MIPEIIEGGSHTDDRGTLLFNNNFDLSKIKRIYLIENATKNVIRGWQGHQIEQRCFSAIYGSFRIELIEVDDWDEPSKNLKKSGFIIDSIKLDVLFVPAGYVSSIQSLEHNSKLLVLADYLMGEIKDEYRFNVDYFR